MMRKNLLLLFLTVGILFVTGTSSRAATFSFSGELNLGYNLDQGFQGPNTLGGYPTDMKLNTLIQVSDQTSANVLLRAQNYGAASNGATDPTPAYPFVDQAYLTYNPGFATFNAGRFVLNAKDHVNILNGLLYNGDYKDGFAIQVLFPVSGNLSAKAWGAVPPSANYSFNAAAPTPLVTTGNETRGDYAVALIYNGANFGWSVNALSIAQDNYFRYSNGWGSTVADTEKGYALVGAIVALNAYVAPAGFCKIYLHYSESRADWRSSDSSHTNSGSDKLRSTIFGISWDDPEIPVYLRAEYDFQKGVSDQGALHPMGFVIGYKFGHGLFLEGQRVQFSDDKYDAGAYNFNRNYFKFKLVF